MQTPVAIFIFNRPQLTKQVFEKIRQAQPSKLLVVADGPRFPQEAALCDAARAATETVDWDCEVLRNYVNTNLGCRKRVSSGLDWIFEQCEEAIILEDDCIPHPSFFRFCSELLDKHREDEQVMLIAGNNFSSFENMCTADSYYFSHFFTAWGWATWRKVWANYDVEMTQWPKLRKKRFLTRIWKSRKLVKFWTDILDRTYAGEIDTWDFQLFFMLWLQRGLVATASTNLISNVGFGSDATHTKHLSPQAKLRTDEMVFPLKSPNTITHDTECSQSFYDIWEQKAVKWVRTHSRWIHLYKRLRSLLLSS